MARIRTLKPEILEDEKTANLSHEAWRLFVSLIVLADDFGAVRAEPAWLHGQIFWSTPLVGNATGLTEAMEELAAEELVIVYQVRGQRYVQVANWEKHQRVDNRGKPRVPRPDDADAWAVPRSDSDRVYFVQAQKSKAIKIGFSWNPTQRLAAIQVGHSEHLSLIFDMPGRRSDEAALHRRFAHLRLSGEWFRPGEDLLGFIRESREGLAKGSVDGSESLASDPDQGSGTTTTKGSNDLPGSARPRESGKSIPPGHTEIAGRVLTTLSKYSGVAYQLERNGAPTKAVKLISSLLTRGLTEMDLRSIAAYCGHETGKGWANKPEMAEYLRPETLYGPDKHESYLDPARAWYRKNFGEEQPNG